MTTTVLTRAETARLLEKQTSLVILTHRRPDGDTLGSAAVLCRGLRQLGKTAYILENPQITPKYAPLHEGLTTKNPEEKAFWVSVDVASPSMLPEEFAPYQEKITLRIDHHGTATSFTPMELVDAASAATGEVVYDVLKLMGAELDAPMAEALFTAVSTDTGCFRYANTTPHSFQVAAACAEKSNRLHEITQELFETNSLGRLRLQGWLVEHARFLKGGKGVVCALPKAVEEELGLREDDLENISGFPRTIEGVKMAATLREDGENRIKISVRAVPGYDAAAVCSRFGGGGHKGAAGGLMKMSLEEAAQALGNAMEEVL